MPFNSGGLKNLRGVGVGREQEPTIKEDVVVKRFRTTGVERHPKGLRGETWKKL